MFASFIMSTFCSFFFLVYRSTPCYRHVHSFTRSLKNYSIDVSKQWGTAFSTTKFKTIKVLCWFNKCPFCKFLGIYLVLYSFSFELSTIKIEKVTDMNFWTVWTQMNISFDVWSLKTGIRRAFFTSSKTLSIWKLLMSCSTYSKEKQRRKT